MALLAALVIFTVIARYCFSLSWKQLAEFNTTLFAFTTFWGMGINVIKDEHGIATIPVVVAQQLKARQTQRKSDRPGFTVRGITLDRQARQGQIEVIAVRPHQADPTLQLLGPKP